MNEIKAQLLVTENIRFNPENKLHSIDNVINELRVSLFPSVAITNVLVKTWLDPDKEYTLRLEVQNVKGNTLMAQQLQNIKNKRNSDLLPGMDFHLNFRFAVLETGNYYYRLYEGSRMLTEYPLYIRN